MKLIKTDIPDLYVIEPRVFHDERGHFYESYNADVFSKYDIHYKFVQDNHSKSSFGVLRGLHYQKGVHAQTKLVRVTSGKVIDVAVDIRKGSPTYLKVFSIELSEENKRQLLIPKGFAHGFVVLSEKAEFLYKCDTLYNQASEGGINFADPTLNVDWGLNENEIIVNEKDKAHPLLENADFDFPFSEFSKEKLYA